MPWNKSALSGIETLKLKNSEFSERRDFDPMTAHDERSAAYHARLAPGIIRLPSGETEGMEPREMNRSLLKEIGHSRMPLLRFVAAQLLIAHSGPTGWEPIPSGRNAAKRKRRLQSRQESACMSRS